MEAESSASGDEQPVVLVEVGLGEEVDAVLLHDRLRAARYVLVCETGDIPRADDALRCDERRAGVHDGRAAVRASERERHGSVGRQEAAAVLVERIGHLDLSAGELVVVQSRALLEQEHAHSVTYQGCERARNGSAARPGPDDDDVGVDGDHRRTVQPRAVARYPSVVWTSGRA